MNKKEALEILTEMQEWRKAMGKYSKPGAMLPFTPSKYGEALDLAIGHLSGDIDTILNESIDPMVLWGAFDGEMICHEDSEGRQVQEGDLWLKTKEDPDGNLTVDGYIMHKGEWISYDEFNEIMRG